MRSHLPLAATVFACAAATAGAQTPPDPAAIHAQVAAALKRAHVASAYQGGPEQSERFSRKVKLGRDGRCSIANIAGDIVVTGGSGDEVSIEAVKRTRGSKDELSNVQIIVEDHPGRVDVRTDHNSNRANRRDYNDHVSVDYTITVPSSATLEVHSVSGTIKITGVRGSVRAESVSGEVTTTDTPKVEQAKSVSGNVSLSGISTDGDLAAGSVSGNVTARGVKAHGLDLNSVSGDIRVTDITCDRFGAKSVSGGVEYSGSIVKDGSYDINVHSGSIRMSLSNPPGFQLTATSFSGSIHSELPLTMGGDSSDRDRSSRRGSGMGMGNHSIRATFGDGSATITLRTFSGDITISKK